MIASRGLSSDRLMLIVLLVAEGIGVLAYYRQRYREGAISNPISQLLQATLTGSPSTNSTTGTHTCPNSG